MGKRRIKSGLKPLYLLKIEGFKMVLRPSRDLLHSNTELLVKTSRRLSYNKTTSDGLGSDNTNGVYVDESGNIYVATNGGLSISN